MSFQTADKWMLTEIVLSSSLNSDTDTNVTEVTNCIGLCPDDSGLYPGFKLQILTSSLVSLHSFKAMVRLGKSSSLNIVRTNEQVNGISNTNQY